MVSFISILPILIFLLSNGYFALPIVDEQLSTSTYLPENHLLTTEETFNLRSVADEESTTSSDVNPKRSTDQHMQFEMSTSVAGLDKETSTVEAMSITTEEPSDEKRAYDHSSSSSWESLAFTTEQAHSDKREDDELSYTTVQSTTELAQFNRRGVANELENDTQEMKVELTTSDMSFSTSTQVSEFSTSKSSTSIPRSTKKYIGHLKDDNEYDEEDKSTKSKKIPKKSSQRKSKVYSEEKSDDEDSTVPTAVFDQQALDQVPNVPNDFLMLDESNNLIVTSLPTRIFPSTRKHRNNKEEEETQPLNQGKNSAHIEEKESNN